METQHHIFCGGIPAKKTGKNTTQLTLNLWRNRPEVNVRLTIEHLHEKLYKIIPVQFHDLLEIAAYVASGDHAIRRGALGVPTSGWAMSIMICGSGQKPGCAFNIWWRIKLSIRARRGISWMRLTCLCAKTGIIRPPPTLRLTIISTTSAVGCRNCGRI